MIKASKTVWRETDSTIRSRGKRYPIIAGLKSGGMVLALRLKKHRQEYTLPIEWCFYQAVEAHLLAERQRKRDERTRRKLCGK